MPIWSQVYPTEQSPGKFQIEKMYESAWRHDPKFFQPQDGDNFGLDLVVLREQMEVRMRAPLAQLRRQVPGLWKRMTKAQRVLFWMAYFNSAMQYAEAIAADMERELGTPEQPHGLPHVARLADEFKVAVVRALKPEIEQEEKRR